MNYCVIFTLLSFFTYFANAQEFNCGDKLTDQRDGQVYATVKIGDQCWMAENLNFGKVVADNSQTDNGEIEKTCYDNEVSNCKQLGGLYTWHEAVQYEVNNQVDVCPSGWHLPDRSEWEKLISHLGEKTSGTQLKASTTDEPSWDGTNTTGFDAIPAGNGYQGNFGRKGHHAYFWTSTEKNDHFAWFTHLDGHWDLYKYTNLYLGDIYLKENAFSVRCIKD